MLGTIKKLVSDDLLLLIEGAATAKAALNIVKAQLLAKNTACFITTICSLFSLKKKPDQSIAAYFAELNSLITLTVTNTCEDIKHNAALPDPNMLNAGELLPFMVEYLKKLLQHYISKHAMAVALTGLPEEYNITKAIIGNWVDFDV